VLFSHYCFYSFTQRFLSSLLVCHTLFHSLFCFFLPSFIYCLFLYQIWYPSSMVLFRAKTKTCYSVSSPGTRKRFAYSSSRDCGVPVVAMWSSPTSCYVHPVFVAWPQSLNRVDLTMWTTVLTMNVIGLLKVGRVGGGGSPDITVCILSAFRPFSLETDIAFCIAVSNNCIKGLHLHYRQYVLHFTQSVKKIFGSWKDEVTGGWKKWHTEYAIDLYTPPNT